MARLAPSTPLASLVSAALLVAVPMASVGLTGCGFRSEPNIEGSSESGSGGDESGNSTTGGTGDDDSAGLDEGPSQGDGGGQCPLPDVSPSSAGGCANPHVLLDDGTVRTGHMSACSNFSTPGWCGASGSEVVYSFRIPYNSDVTFHAESNDFSPILRVVETPWDLEGNGGFACNPDPLRHHAICGPVSPARPGYNLFVSKDTTYYVIVDSDSERDSGEFRIWAEIGPSVEVLNCGQQIVDSINLGAGDGTVFEGWFEPGQGRMSSWCGGAGTEQIVEVTAQSSGVLRASVQADPGLHPQLSLQRSCDSKTIDGVGSHCKDWEQDSNTSAEPLYLNRNESVYVVVDHLSVEAGEYYLVLEFDE